MRCEKLSNKKQTAFFHTSSWTSFPIRFISSCLHWAHGHVQWEQDYHHPSTLGRFSGTNRPPKHELTINRSFDTPIRFTFFDLKHQKPYNSMLCFFLNANLYHPLDFLNILVLITFIWSHHHPIQPPYSFPNYIPRTSHDFLGKNDSVKLFNVTDGGAMVPWMNLIWWWGAPSENQRDYGKTRPIWRCIFLQKNNLAPVTGVS